MSTCYVWWTVPGTFYVLSSQVDRFCFILYTRGNRQLIYLQPHRWKVERWGVGTWWVWLHCSVCWPWGVARRKRSIKNGVLPHPRVFRRICACLLGSIREGTSFVFSSAVKSSRYCIGRKDLCNLVTQMALPPYHLPPSSLRLLCRCKTHPLVI